MGAESASQNTAAGPRLSNNQQQPLLLIEDDAAGLSPQQLRRSLGIPSRANSFSSLVAAGSRASSTSSRAASCAASQCPDFVHAALRLGSTVLVLTKRRGQGASVGLLHASSAPTGRDEAWLEAAVVDFAADGSRRLTPSGAAIQPAAPANSASTLAWHSAAEAAAAETASSAWTAAAGTVCRRWPGGATEAQLAAELAALPEQGTCLLVAGLYTQAASAAGALGEAYELNWSEDPADVQLQRGQRLAAALAAGALQGAPRQAGMPPFACLHTCLLAGAFPPHSTLGLTLAAPTPPSPAVQLPCSRASSRASRGSRRRASRQTRGCSAAPCCASRCAPTWLCSSCAGQRAGACACGERTWSTSGSGGCRGAMGAGQQCVASQLAEQACLQGGIPPAPRGFCKARSPSLGPRLTKPVTCSLATANQHPMLQIHTSLHTYLLVIPSLIACCSCFPALQRLDALACHRGVPATGHQVILPACFRPASLAAAAGGHSKASCKRCRASAPRFQAFAGGLTACAVGVVHCTVRN